MDRRRIRAATSLGSQPHRHALSPITALATSPPSSQSQAVVISSGVDHALDDQARSGPSGPNPPDSSLEDLLGFSLDAGGQTAQSSEAAAIVDRVSGVNDLTTNPGNLKVLDDLMAGLPRPHSDHMPSAHPPTATNALLSLSHPPVNTNVSSWPADPVTTQATASDALPVIHSSKESGRLPSVLTGPSPSDRLLSATTWTSGDPGEFGDDIHRLDCNIASGQSSGSSFLDKIYRNLSSTIALRSFPRTISEMDESEIDPTPESDLPFLPNKATAELYVNCYFGHCAATYRFVSQATIKDELQRVYGGMNPGTASETALLLELMAVGSVGPMSSIPIVI